MFGLKASTILSLLAVFQASSAIPFGQLTSMMPRDVAYIGVDEDRGEYVAYNLDGTTYGRYAIDSKGESVSKRAAGKCANLSIDELKTIPGWNALNQYADSTWGTGKREVVTNPEEYLDSPAQVCITDEVVNLNFHEEPICQEHTSSVSGILIGTEGEVSIEVEQGFNTATSYTVTSASTIGVSSTLSVSMGIPAVADVSAELTVNTEITDEVSSTFEVSYNDISRVSLTITAAEGEKCTAETTVKTCNRQATGEVRYLASGWVWFNYHKRTQGHYKWAASIEGVLTNQDDRSSFAEFKGAMSSDSRSSYQGTCV